MCEIEQEDPMKASIAFRDWYRNCGSCPGDEFQGISDGDCLLETCWNSAVQATHKALQPKFSAAERVGEALSVLANEDERIQAILTDEELEDLNEAFRRMAEVWGI